MLRRFLLSFCSATPELPRQRAYCARGRSAETPLRRQAPRSPYRSLEVTHASYWRNGAYSRLLAPISVSLIGLRSPARAAVMILRATISTMGSLRSFKPGLAKAAVKA